MYYIPSHTLHVLYPIPFTCNKSHPNFIGYPIPFGCIPSQIGQRRQRSPARFHATLSYHQRRSERVESSIFSYHFGEKRPRFGQKCFQLVRAHEMPYEKWAQFTRGGSYDQAMMIPTMPMINFSR